MTHYITDFSDHVCSVLLCCHLVWPYIYPKF